MDTSVPARERAHAAITYLRTPGSITLTARQLPALQSWLAMVHAVVYPQLILFADTCATAGFRVTFSEVRSMDGGEPFDDEHFRLGGSSSDDDVAAVRIEPALTCNLAELTDVVLPLIQGQMLDVQDLRTSIASGSSRRAAIVTFSLCKLHVQDKPDQASTAAEELMARLLACVEKVASQQQTDAIRVGTLAVGLERWFERLEGLRPQARVPDRSEPASDGQVNGIQAPPGEGATEDWADVIEEDLEVVVDRSWDASFPSPPLRPKAAPRPKAQPPPLPTDRIALSMRRRDDKGGNGKPTST